MKSFHGNYLSLSIILFVTKTIHKNKAKQNYLILLLTARKMLLVGGGSNSGSGSLLLNFLLCLQRPVDLRPSSKSSLQNNIKLTTKLTP